MAYDEKWREAELIAKVKKDFFANDEFDTTEYIGNIDFSVVQKPNLFTINENPSKPKQALFWAEAKRGKSDNIKSIVQLILTIGRAKTHEKYLPPEYIGAFNATQIAFVPFVEIAGVFNQNDFNFSVAANDYTTKEFKQLHSSLDKILKKQSLVFDFFDQKDNFNVYLQRFIKNLGVKHGNAVKIGITASNFSKKPYFEWLDFVKPTINADFEKPLEKNIFTPSHNEFYLADLFADENSNETLQKTNLRLVLKNNYYVLKNDENGKQNVSFYFKDCDYNNPESKPKAHTLFWKNYQRPPLKQYWENILKKRHLLAPQDKKQYQGAFFTPKIWTLKAKEYLESVLGKDFEKKYIIWDCAAGTGNLLEFFSIEARANIYASTLDEADVKIMLQRVKNEKRFPLYERHIFQFDFLNDDFSKLPQDLQDILNDEKKRQKLIIFINPPYAEAGDSKTERETGKPKKLIAKKNKIYQQYKDILGKASNELFAQFLIRIYVEIQGCVLAQFSKLKIAQGQNFAKFRKTFKAEFKKGFCVPASSFDNVKSDFPIGFMIWDTKNKKTKQIIELEICDTKNEISKDKKTKKFYSDEPKRINQWLKNYDDKTNNEQLAILMADAPDFQQTKHIALINNAGTSNIIYKKMTTKNIIPCCIYFAVRHAIKATWLNDRDQFLYPNDKWEKDSEFQNDCLAFALFHRQNQISSEKGTNNFIPFTDTELDMRKDKFESCFMSNFIAGKCEKSKIKSDLELGLGDEFIPTKPLKFSKEAEAVFEAGRKIWRYYHQNASDKDYNVNASLYDIKAHFQGRNSKGKMNNTSKDEGYNKLMDVLSEALKALAEKIALKIYDYGFLRE